MGIIKQAKNLTITLMKEHIVMAGEIEKTADTMKIVATYGNIELNSVKKVVKNGNIG